MFGLWHCEFLPNLDKDKGVTIGHVPANSTHSWVQGHSDTMLRYEVHPPILSK
jgi:hypothetical protein